ncbi:hypothetical protein ACFLV3_06225 [Chloroflexota bacterium]
MRRVISVVMVLAGLFAIMTGIWNFFPPFSLSFSPVHAIGATVFGSICIIHVWLNWKSVLRYFRGLGWWWLPVGLGFIAIGVLAILPVIHE